jgi:hypothetical protein
MKWTYKGGMRVPPLGLAAVVAYCLAAPSDRAVRGAPLVPQHISNSAVISDPAQAVVYSCPMDPDVRSDSAGKCRRCGMALVAGVPEPVEFHTDVVTIPEGPKPGRQAVLQFSIHDPWKDRPVSGFNLVHEKLFHAFVVSQDLQFFEHGHPSLVLDGVFQYPITFPKPGMYRALGDFFPDGGMPQLSSETVFVRGEPPPPVHLDRDYSPKTATNLSVKLGTIPERPVATARTQLRFVVEGDRGLEKYLGVWGHMLVASSDLIDMMHEHPFLADGGPRVEFEIVFPRPGAYRVWVQFQSDGVVNTAHFDIPVGSLQ